MHYFSNLVFSWTENIIKDSFIYFITAIKVKYIIMLVQTSLKHISIGRPIFNFPENIKFANRFANSVVMLNFSVP